MRRIVVTTLSTATLAAMLSSCSLVSKRADAEPATQAALTGASSQSQTVPTTGVLQTRPTDIKGIAVDLTECSRRSGVLTIKVNFRNTGVPHPSGSLAMDIFSQQLYFVAEDRKYFVLRDSEGAKLDKGDVYSLPEPGDQVSWWAKFPAPPEDVRTVTLLSMPGITPFDDLPISEH